jgi:hypothetical protein
MTTLREAAQQALEALETPIHEQAFMQRQNAITALRAALEQPEQEPVAWVHAKHLQGLTLGLYGYAEIYTDESLGRIPVYTHPPRREWQGLTEEEAAACWSASAVDTWKAIEAALKEKNA